MSDAGRARLNRLRYEEDGQLLLVLAYAVIAGLLVTVVVDVSQAYLYRRSLLAAADAAALSAANQPDLGRVYTEEGLALPLSEQGSRRAVTQYAQDAQLSDRFDDFEVRNVDSNGAQRDRHAARRRSPAVRQPRLVPVARRLSASRTTTRAPCWPTSSAKVRPPYPRAAASSCTSRATASGGCASSAKATGGCADRERGRRVRADGDLDWTPSLSSSAPRLRRDELATQLAVTLSGPLSEQIAHARRETESPARQRGDGEQIGARVTDCAGHQPVHRDLGLIGRAGRSGTGRAPGAPAGPYR
jgi:Putative Flp pilus-assembly TadE/G-like